MRLGNLQAVAASAPTDRGNTFVLIDGSLIFSLDKDTYEQLGLTGQASPFKALRGQFWNITVDIAASSFAPGRPLYDRVLWCLRERVLPMELFLSWTDQTGAQSEIIFPESISGSVKRIVCSPAVSRLRGVPIPMFEAAEEILRSQTLGLGAQDQGPDQGQDDDSIASSRLMLDAFDWVVRFVFAVRLEAGV